MTAAMQITFTAVRRQQVALNDVFPKLRGPGSGGGPGPLKGVCYAIQIRKVGKKKAPHRECTGQGERMN